MDWIKFFIFVAVCGGLLLGRPVTAVETPLAVGVRFEQTSGLIRTGDIVPVVVRIDSHGQSINATELNLSFSTIGLVVDHISQEQSIFSVWAEQPTWDNARGTIQATAGRPNGIIASDASVMTIYFRTPASGSWEISAANTTRFLLNDGLGTAVAALPIKSTINVVDSLVPVLTLTSKSNPVPESWSRGPNIDVSWELLPNAQYSFAFTSRADHAPDETPEKTNGHEFFPVDQDGIYYFAISQYVGGVWSPIFRRRFLVDRTKPKEFTIIRLPGSQLDGRDALTWLANDATSGIAAVTVLVSGQTIHNPTVPLPVATLWRGQEVTVVLVDQAGNERRALYKIPGTAPAPGWLIGVLVAVAVGAGGGAWWVHHKR